MGRNMKFKRYVLLTDLLKHFCLKSVSKKRNLTGKKKQKNKEQKTKKSYLVYIIKVTMNKSGLLRQAITA